MSESNNLRFGLVGEHFAAAPTNRQLRSGTPCCYNSPSMQHFDKMGLSLRGGRVLVFQTENPGANARLDLSPSEVVKGLFMRPQR